MKEKASNEIDKLIELYYSKLAISVNDPNECRHWEGGCNSSGYGYLYLNGKQYSAHRLSYIIHNGDIPKGLLIRHTCDNPTCVNPKHLITGTKHDNILDASQRGRLITTLNVESVKVIKWMIKHRNRYGLMNKLARLYKVNRKAIYKIHAGITWKHVHII